jgi:hypothetical protein
MIKTINNSIEKNGKTKLSVPKHSLSLFLYFYTIVKPFLNFYLLLFQSIYIYIYIYIKNNQTTIYIYIKNNQTTNQQ